jgi:invasion protein IalB
MRSHGGRFAIGLAVAVATFGIGASPLQAQQQPRPPQTRPAAQPPATPPQAQAAPSSEATGSTGGANAAAAPPGSGWRVECTNDGKSLDCRAVQQVVLRDNQQLVAGLVVRVPAETKKPVMMVQMPLGVIVSEPVELIIDDGKPEKFNIQTCNQQGCFVGAPIADTLLAAMRSGTRLRIVFQNGNKQAITVTMPLAGFGLAYDKVRS